MARSNLKLYRGLSADEFKFASKYLSGQNKKVWSVILDARATGDFSYPSHLDKAISSLHRDLRLEYQHFTDSRVIAESYARKVSGLLVEISVPLKDVVGHFDIEFQNFGRRKKQFEIVYAVRGTVLEKFGKSWKLKVRKNNAYP